MSSPLHVALVESLACTGTRVNDMLAILFPHMFEEIQYLLPPEEDGDETAMEVETRGQREQLNAEAGPSRVAI